MHNIDIRLRISSEIKSEAETINSFNEKEEGAYSESSLYEFKKSLNLD